MAGASTPSQAHRRVTAAEVVQWFQNSSTRWKVPTETHVAGLVDYINTLPGMSLPFDTMLRKSDPDMGEEIELRRLIDAIRRVLPSRIEHKRRHAEMFRGYHQGDFYERLHGNLLEAEASLIKLEDSLPVMREPTPENRPRDVTVVRGVSGEIGRALERAGNIAQKFSQKSPAMKVLVACIAAIDPAHKVKPDRLREYFRR